MNAVAGIVAGLLTAAGTWMLLSGSVGGAMARRLCGEDIWAVPCVLVGVVLAYLLPLVTGAVAGVLVWLTLKRKRK